MKKFIFRIKYAFYMWAYSDMGIIEAWKYPLPYDYYYDDVLKDGDKPSAKEAVRTEMSYWNY